MIPSDIEGKTECAAKRNFLSFGVPLWIVILFLLVLAGGLSWLALYAKNHVVYSYTINVPGSNNKPISLQYGARPELANSNYFLKIKDSLINQKISFIEADLSTMKLAMYQNGKNIKEVPILTKGKDGSWWETPAGLYKIESKETNHFSSIGKVYQPWSMVFQGNFFIHGWPYYQDGTPVSTTYSGGCIRLDTNDAKEIFALASVGMPVLVYEKDFSRDDFIYNVKQPPILAKSYLLADLKNDTVLLQKDAGTPAPIASITKLITALVSAEYINLDKPITISQSDIVHTSKARLKAGQDITAYNLLFPLLMESSNEAAEALAHQLGRERFIELMNQKAQALGMVTSHFSDPAGSDSGNTSTLVDLFALAKYIYNNRSFIFKISSGNITSSAYGQPIFQNLSNFNTVPYVSDTFIGGKIGKTTAAGETYLGVFQLTIHGEKRPIAVAVLDSTDVYGDIALMLDYVHTSYQE